MSKTKRKIGLIAKSISFTNFSIVYDVEFSNIFNFTDLFNRGYVVCHPSIKYKDLILQPTFIEKDNMQVIFNPSNPTPHFYQAIMKKTIHDVDEFKVELNNIYMPGDIVGYAVF